MASRKVKRRRIRRRAVRNIRSFLREYKRVRFRALLMGEETTVEDALIVSATLTKYALYANVLMCCHSFHEAWLLEEGGRL